MLSVSVLTLALAVLLTLVPDSISQVPIPPRPLGFVYGDGSPTARVVVDFFTDLLCPDSKAAYPTLKAVAEHYSAADFQLKFHLFPLPYHHNAFSVAQAAMTITQALGDDHFVPWMETMYEHQEMFWNKQTQFLGQVQVTKNIETIALTTFPDLTKTMWDKGMTGHGGTDMDSLTRMSWKYACTRGVAGTPVFFVNGVPVDAGSDWSVDQWISIIDPLIPKKTPSSGSIPVLSLNKASTTGQEQLPLSTNGIFFTESACDSGSDPCHFAPHRVMCCLNGAVCTPGVGCTKY